MKFALLLSVLFASVAPSAMATAGAENKKPATPATTEQQAEEEVVVEGEEEAAQ